MVTTWQPDKRRTKKQVKNQSQRPNIRKVPGPAGWPRHTGSQNSTMWPGADPDLLVSPHGPLSHSGPLGHLSPCAGPAIASVISLLVGNAGSFQEVAERSLAQYDENMMCKAGISLWSTNMYLGTRYYGFRNVPAGVPPSVGRGRHRGPQHTFSILAEPDASNRCGNAAAILQPRLERQALSQRHGAAHGRRGLQATGHRQWEEGRNKGLEGPPQELPGSLARSEHDIPESKVLRVLLHPHCLRLQDQYMRLEGPLWRATAPSSLVISETQGPWRRAGGEILGYTGWRV
ncbi:uncharacterized protein LOC125105157 isoform X2 [Lutra lutra]|nr:uncharacterized protein LOC125105157 isoform X2 [Lutra lutra]XP_047594308.1 uncharacterized protein LOC125105157 isoform X2 [Lutra lutra]XP_047594313.1 uncharacterized protein LOC125105157 isoform X2 [Lutra lutra]